MSRLADAWLMAQPRPGEGDLGDHPVADPEHHRDPVAAERVRALVAGVGVLEDPEVVGPPVVLEDVVAVEVVHRDVASVARPGDGRRGNPSDPGRDGRSHPHQRRDTADRLRDTQARQRGPGASAGGFRVRSALGARVPRRAQPTSGTRSASWTATASSPTAPGPSGAHRLANALHDLGVEPGDRVSLITYNTHHLLEAYYGVLEAGAVLNPVNIRLTPHEIAYILEHAGSKVVFSTDSRPSSSSSPRA